MILELDRTTSPDFTPVNGIDLPKGHQFKISGIPIHLVDAGSQPVLRVEIVLKSGGFYESKPGLSFFTSKMLLEGTSSKSSEQISENFEFYGSQIDISVGLDFVNITLYCLRKNLERNILVICELLTDSTFPDYEFQRLKDLKRQEILVNSEKTSFLASKRIRQQLFGPAHPYGSSLEVEDIQSLNRSELLDYYKNILFGEAEVFIAGHLDNRITEDVGPMMSILSDLNINQIKTTPQINCNQDLHSYNLEKSVQSSVRLAQISISRSHPDYFKMLVTNEILGGYFGSRLMKNIREEKGYTYGISSSLAHPLQSSFMVIGTDVNKENTQKTLSEISREMIRLQTDLVPEEELETVKNYMVGHLLSSIDTPFGIMDKHKILYYSNLSDDFYLKFPEQIMNVSQGDVLDMAQKHLNFESFSKVVVG